MPQVIRPAQKSDHAAISRFINTMAYVHRHLDWRDSLEWLGREPFWLIEENGSLQGALACPPEPAEVAWVRLFAAATQSSPDRTWKKLFERSLDAIYNIKPAPMLTTLAMRDWYEELIKRNGFRHYQDIVVYIFDTEPPPPPKLGAEYQIRAMEIKDLRDVAQLDNQAFEPIWRLSTGDLLYAAKKSSYCTVIEREGEIVAYQMSSTSGMYAHLARLAVKPSLQHQRLGFALLQHLLDHFISQQEIWGVTLNTQDSNSSSINLYQKIGFRETGERFPVYMY
jgi:ribosomal protein S18 acetylase RimI-like enzyme